MFRCRKFKVYSGSGSWKGLSNVNHNGTITGATFVPHTTAAGAAHFDFDGSNDNVDVGSLGTSGEFSESTISVWFQKDTQVSNYGNVFDCNYNVTTANKGPRMEVDIAGSVVRIYMGTDGGSYTTISFGSLSNNTWYNLVLTVSPTVLAKILRLTQTVI